MTSYISTVSSAGGALALYSILKRQGDIDKPHARLDSHVTQYSAGPRRSGLVQQGSVVSQMRASGSVMGSSGGAPAAGQAGVSDI